jgi:DNA-binding response OmpR family regulator
MAARILITEGEQPLTMLLRYNFEVEDYEVDVAERGHDAEIKLREVVLASLFSSVNIARAFRNRIVPAPALPS